MVDPTVIIMRGWPGSGKSTLVRSICDYLWTRGNGIVGEDVHSILSTKICSADSFHVNPVTNKYEWKAENQKQAHEYCRSRFSRAIYNRNSLIIVDNTNIKRRDYAFYVHTAQAEGYITYQAIPESEHMYSVDECFRRNVHNVPLATIQRMMNEFEIDDQLERFKLPH